VEAADQDDESWSIAGLPAARNFLDSVLFSLFASSARRQTQYRQVSQHLPNRPIHCPAAALPTALLVPGCSVWDANPRSWAPSHQFCPSISRIIFLTSHLPALSFLKFFQGAISAAFHTIDHSQTPSKSPAWCRRTSIASTPLNHPSSTGRFRPTTLHT
jgi:hypothetical protein